jgi:hypothetical protein
VAGSLGLPSFGRCVIAALMGVSIAGGCDRRVFEFEDQGIGEEVGDSETDTTEGETDGETDTETGGSTACTASVASLTITDATNPATVECVTKVVGNLVVGPSVGLTDLGMLSKLREVGGTLYIVGNLGLTSLEGLEELESVGWLHIRRNHALTDLHGLDGLEDVQQISVFNNDGLVSLVGLPEGLAPSKLEIGGNDDLLDLDGLPLLNAPGSGNPIEILVDDHESLTNVGGLATCCSTQPVVIVLSRNDALVDLDGLEPFQRFETLRLVDNRALADLAGIDATQIGTFEVSYNHCSSDPGPVLDDFVGMEQLISIDLLIVEWAASLVGFDGLENMNDVSKIEARNNAKLGWNLVEDLAGQTGAMYEGCGGLGGDTCEPEPCQTF